MLSGVGSVPVQQPRIEDRRPRELRETLDRKILPPCLRRTQNIDEAIPWMYLYGVNANDMGDSLKALLGPAAESLSPNTVTRLISQWQSDYDQWNTRSLAAKKVIPPVSWL